VRELIETIALMQKRRGIQTVGSVLDPTIPIDIGERTQRQRIVEAMVECCAEKTYAATTIADIVSHASISRTTFYKRFCGKRECFDAALDWCIEEVQAAVVASQSPSDSPAVAVRKGGAAILRLMAAKPALTQLVLGEAGSVEPAVIGRYRKLLIPALEKLWIDAGEPRKGRTDPRLAFGRAQVLIYNQITAGQAEQLPELLPEVVYIALLPFSGHEEALRQARLTGSVTDAELSSSL
jgi:AcrR family transcriptional regulator